MSLINKVLQDLDKRGGAGDGAPLPLELKAVPVPERERRPVLLAGAGVAAVLVLAVGGWYGWRVWQGQRAVAGPVPKVVSNQPPPGARSIAPAPVLALTPAPVSAVEAAPALAQAGAGPVAQSADGVAAASTPEVAQGPVAGPPIKIPRPPSEPRPARAALATNDSALPPVRATPARAAPAASGGRQGVPEADARGGERKVAAAEGISRREPTPKLESDGAYRRALLALQEGRVSVAMADLERAVEIDPRNEAARQTYVSLLLENKRTDDAIRQLRLSLGVDPRQPGLAMVLARLQLERGGPALETLMKTLPYAGESADYQAFVAGVLQREQRHAEAVRYYQAALKLAPLNGVWWMGLGISLQAGGQLPEAREAFSRARGANGLTPELQAFIDRKLEQLAR